MRIAYVIADEGIPVSSATGASTHVREMVNAFAGAGHRVTLVAAAHGQGDSPIAADIVTIGSEDKAWAITLPQRGLGGKTPLREALAMQLGVTAMETLLRVHATRPFDLIYERYSLFSAAGVRAARRLGIPCFVEVNAPLLLEQRRFRKLTSIAEAEAIETEVFETADGVLTVSEPVRAYALGKGARPTHTHVVPNGVDLTRFHPGVQTSVPDDLAGRFIVGFSGSMKAWHGLEVLMEAFRVLAQWSPAYHLLVVGDGPLRGWIDGYVRGARLDGAVTMTGWVPPPELPGLLKAMDVAVAPYPATEDFYFSPLKLYEYMAVGAPVVASRLGQIAQTIRHGETGLLVEPGDPIALASQIERLRTDPVLRVNVGARAACRAADFTWEQNVRTVIDLATHLSRARPTRDPICSDGSY